jgi:hypothetical protein
MCYNENYEFGRYIMISVNITCMDNGDDLEKSLLSYDNVEVIREKGFNGEPLLEVFINSMQIIAIVASIIVAKINTKKVSKIVIEGEKIELEGVSEALIKEVLERKWSEKT